MAGFNPKMKFERTKTLMEGDGYCDHCYTLK
ncbi:MAG: L-2-amino-thiazoline-4-carboxylic acid hydrolase [Candidatus Thorarchaeota archaeon]